ERIVVMRQLSEGFAFSNEQLEWLVRLAGGYDQPIHITTQWGEARESARTGRHRVDVAFGRVKVHSIDMCRAGIGRKHEHGLPIRTPRRTNIASHIDIA